MLQRIIAGEMGKDILINHSDEDADYDGDEADDTEYQEWLDDWRFEMNTYNY